jgi:AraC-like DNA-binding protein
MSYREEIPEARKEELLAYMQERQTYLDPELNLRDLAASLHMSRSQLSDVINNGFGKNFNDFINSYRVDHFKQLLRQGRQEHLSLLGLAYESGFNSKATFNRVFRKFTGQSPSEYLNSIP